MTFLSPALFSARIDVPATAPTGTYEVEVVLYAGGVQLARQTTNFEVIKTGIEQRLATGAHDRPLLYGLATGALRCSSAGSPASSSGAIEPERLGLASTISAIAAISSRAITRRPRPGRRRRSRRRRWSGHPDAAAACRWRREMDLDLRMRLALETFDDDEIEWTKAAAAARASVASGSPRNSCISAQR